MDSPARSNERIVNAAVSIAVAGLVSSGHHWYGAIAYETPWRWIVSRWIPAVVAVVLLTLYLHWKHQATAVGRLAAWFVLVCGGFFWAGFTLFECGYSHVLKNILFYGGASRATLEFLFPAPAYHLPDNVIFEITGLLQLVGFWAAWMAYRVFKERPIAA